MPKDILDLEATPERLQALVDAGVLPPPYLRRARDLALAPPSREDWQRFLATTLIALGSLLVLSGVIYFFAYNWAGLHRFAKLGLIGLGITGCTLAAVGSGPLSQRFGHFGLLAATVLVGPLLAVYGQAYQTGADAFELFVGWAALILPWVAVSRFSPLWLLLLVLVDVGAVLVWKQLFDGADDLFTWWVVGIALFNGFAWATYEHFANLRVPWLQARGMARVFACMTVAPLLVVSIGFVVVPRSTGPAGTVAVVLLLATFAAEYALHRHLGGELFLLTLGALCAMTLVTTVIGHASLESQRFDDVAFTFFVLSIAIIAQVALAVWWLRREARATGTTEES
ncbi:DUF2157 domain-containing protein [Myxococcus sp. K15C18031901]|uniref:DUF2157 domain-containing protein n=1 Tax=Myxococcus dinghuensis TaxID=2906761 RepID=UPI0020A837CC|nr:DUF2157 domain-containing protein [Myxococcus dinghuensis]MCP3103291.1 DUF2157 domain-containing protein [Myxococcus dinghuensis]